MPVPGKVLFVCYGSGHVRMVVPVAKALQEAGLARVQVLGLTTAATVVRNAGLELLQIKDFLLEHDAPALAMGRELVAAMGEVADIDESIAYMGLCYAELVSRVGPDQARLRYARDGRQAFLPEALLSRILRAVSPDLLVATNSPRAERAAVMAAGSLGIPSVCLVDLFAVDEVIWIGVPGYATRVCVLNEQVRQFLVESGRRPDEVSVTGNPAFDALLDPRLHDEGQALRRAQGWEDKLVLLYPTQVEPAFHPFNGRPGDVTLPSRLLASLVHWVQQQENVVLCVRPRAGEPAPALPQGTSFRVAGQDWPLPTLLAAVDAVATLNSTVGLEGALSGARVIQVLGSVFDEAMPLARFGLADVAVPFDQLSPALERLRTLSRGAAARQMQAATPRVVEVLREFL